MGKVKGSERISTEEVAEFAAASDPILRAKVTGDVHERVVLQADGTILTGSGAAAPTVPAAASVSDAAYDATTWNGVTTVAPSKNAVRDKIESMSGASVPSPTTGDAGKVVTVNVTEDGYELDVPSGGGGLFADPPYALANSTGVAVFASAGQLPFTSPLTVHGTPFVTLTESVSESGNFDLLTFTADCTVVLEINVLVSTDAATDGQVGFNISGSAGYLLNFNSTWVARLAPTTAEADQNIAVTTAPAKVAVGDTLQLGLIGTLSAGVATDGGSQLALIRVA